MRSIVTSIKTITSGSGSGFDDQYHNVQAEDVVIFESTHTWYLQLKILIPEVRVGYMSEIKILGVSLLNINELYKFSSR